VIGQKSRPPHGRDRACAGAVAFDDPRAAALEGDAAHLSSVSSHSAHCECKISGAFWVAISCAGPLLYVRACTVCRPRHNSGRCGP